MRLFFRFWGGFSDFEDAGTGVLDFGAVEHHPVSPFGADLAVDNLLDVAVGGVPAPVDDPEHAEACDAHLGHAAFHRLRRLVGGHTVEVYLVFG